MKNFVLIVAVLAACKKKEPEKKVETPPPPPPPPAADAAAPVAVEWDGKSPLSVTGPFQTPESVLYDAEADVYLVSNINGKPLDADDNGFITKVSVDGKIAEAKWIDGAKDTVKLDAPKGMVIADGILWVTDRTVVRKFDAKTGEPKGEVEIKGASFLNDVTAAPDGGIYVTDSGLDASFASTGSDAVHHIAKDGKTKAVIKNKDLAGPNGVLAVDKSLWVVTFGSGEIYEVDAKGKKQAGKKLPKGKLDGVVAIEGGELLVSSWEGSAVFRGTPAGEWKPVVETIESPADIGWDSKRKRILIPSFMGNSVTIQPL
jgi:sugar lactone lactonase YvrE